MINEAQSPSRQTTAQMIEQHRAAVVWHAQGLDFSDALHLAHSTPDNLFYTFDHKLVSTGGKITAYTFKKP